MALAIFQRPRNYKVSSTAITSYSISLDVSTGFNICKISGGTGINNGDLIYITNSYESYNGFWYVGNAIAPNVFLPRKYENTDFDDRQDFYMVYTRDAANIEIYRSVLSNNASCAHLPIQYRLRSDLSGGSFQGGISSISNDNGYVKITESISSFTLNPLDFVTIRDVNGIIDELGIVQVLTTYSSTVYTLDIPYSVAVENPSFFVGTSVYKHYNNYVARVQIYAGMATSHQWTSLKPYELITEVAITPDPAPNRFATVNVAEIIKSKLSINKNRPNYDSEPYDLDRFCNFYIKYAEEYDQSDGITISRFLSDYTDDSGTFQGLAVDAKLPFKNIYSGYLSAYLNAFLTDGDNSATLFPGYYFDASILKTGQVKTLYVKRYDSSGNLLSTTSSSLSVSEGVYRYPVSQTGSEAKIVLLLDDASFTINVSSDCAGQSLYLTWKNHLGGFNYWLATSNKDYSVDISDTQQQETNIYPNWPRSYGQQADTIRFETSRTSTSRITVRIENLTDAQADFISGIKKSSLVQIMTSKYDKKTVLVDASSFTVRTDNDGLINMEFDIIDTAPFPSQSL